MEEPHAVNLSKIEISDFLISTNGDNSHHNRTPDTELYEKWDRIAGLIRDLKSKDYDWKEVIQFNGITSRPYQSKKEEKTCIVDSLHGVVFLCNMNLKDPEDLRQVINSLYHIKKTYGKRAPKDLSESPFIDVMKLYISYGLDISETFL